MKSRRKVPADRSSSASPFAGAWSFRALASRLQFASRTGVTYGGRRDLYTALGYKRDLTPGDYRERYRRNAIARRVVDALPRATWRAGFALIEDADPVVMTDFEAAWQILDERVRIATVFQRADILAGLGRYSILLIGAPGALDQPLPRMRGPDDVTFVVPCSEADASIDVNDLDTDPGSGRFGLPQFYTLRRSGSVQRKVHWTRAIHVAEGLLDDELYGSPRLEAVWNLLDDLEKVTGGGAEAFWRRADQGYHFNIPPDVEITKDELDRMRDEIEAFVHGFQRWLRTRGVEVRPFGADVANIKDAVEPLLQQIAAGAEMPLRMLTGSERGELASSMDERTWEGRVAERQTSYAEPVLVRAFVDRLIDHGALPSPEAYDVWWPSVSRLSEKERAEVAVALADANVKMQQAGQAPVITTNEVRDQILNLEPVEDVGDRELMHSDGLRAAKWRRLRSAG